MAKCTECGSARVDPDGSCLDCRDDARSEAADARQAELKIDPRRLDEEAPEPDAMLEEPGAWGRGSDAPPARVTPLSPRSRRPTTDRNAALQLEPSPEGAEEPDEAQGNAEVVPLREPPAEDDEAAGDVGEEEARAEKPTPVGHRPPVLASEALRKDLAPVAPAPGAMRGAAVSLGLLGVLGCVALSGLGGLGAVMAGAFAAITVVGLSPVGYASRATAVLTLGGGALTLGIWSVVQLTNVIEPFVLLGSVTVLSTALIFRAWHRASLFARALTLLGVAGCMAWLWMVRSLGALTILDTHWQAWLPPIMQIPLALLLMLSLLAFMDSRSTGACGAWASLLLLWYTAFEWIALLVLYWPVGAPDFDVTRVDPQLASAHFAQPLLAALLSVALAQSLAIASSSERPD